MGATPPAFQMEWFIFTIDVPKQDQEIDMPLSETGIERNRRDIYLSIGVALFSLILISWLIPGFVSDYTTGGRGLSPRFFPYLIAIILALLSLLLLYKNLRQTAGPVEPGKGKVIDRSTIICIVFFLVCQQSIAFIGLIPASFITLIVLMFLYGFRNWLTIGAFSIILIVVLSMFFEKVALVPLPRGSIFESLF